MSDVVESNREEAIRAERHEKASRVLAEFGVSIETEKTPLLSGTQEDVEKFANPWQKDRRTFGAVPHFDQREEIINHFPEEANYFAQHYTPGDKSRPFWMDPGYAKGAILFEMKFGERLSQFCEEILQNYPRLQTDKPGREISVFGLSGSGKSVMVKLMREKMGDGTIVMDSDTVRFNLLAKMIKDIEMEAGASLEEVRKDLMHNNISGPLYFALNHITKELKDRGYDIIQSSTAPVSGADEMIYVENPDGIDPLAVVGKYLEKIDAEIAEKIAVAGGDSIDELTKKQIIREVNEKFAPEITAETSPIADVLMSRTETRFLELGLSPLDFDNFNWSKAEKVTRFEDMVDVTVRIPRPEIHSSFIKNVGETLYRAEEGSIKIFHNPKIADPEARRAAMATEIDRLLQS